MTKNQGEGNREAARQYNEATREFVESGKVKEAATKAGNLPESEKAKLREAEQAGKQHTKEEDPALKRNYHQPDE